MSARSGSPPSPARDASAPRARAGLAGLQRLVMPVSVAIPSGLQPESSERGAPERAPEAPAAPPTSETLRVEPATSRSSPATPSSTLWGGRLRPGEEVGRGAMGCVLRGTDTKLRRELALKVTRKPRKELSTEELARFVEEAQITAQLEHPNVVPVHDIGLSPEGHPYFSMKLVRGRSLETILDLREAGDAETLAEFGLRRLLDIFLQVCQAVDYAHARGVVHRDLKPGNIMVGDFGEVLVMDWGVAKLMSKLEPTPSSIGDGHGEPSDVSSIRADHDGLATHHGAVLGTPAYMAPEQATNPNVDERADIYSLGTILYEILCGQVPFDSNTAIEIIGRLMSEEPRRPSLVDPETPLALEMLALRMLEKDPARRTLTIRQIRSHVQDYIDGIGHTYRTESAVAKALWVLGAIGLFAFLVWYLTGQSVATVVTLTPAVVFNAVGWMLLVMALGYPLWAATTSLRAGQKTHDPFRAATSEEVFVSGYMAHRTFATTIAPLFQLAFIVEVFASSVPLATRGASRELMPQILAQLRAGWAHALVTIVVFLFAYLFFLSSEVRFARRVDRYVTLVRRPAWESVWPLVLIVAVVATVIGTNVLAWTPSTESAGAWGFLRDQVLTPRLAPFELVKTLVFQGTFLVGLVLVTVSLAFPFPELLASLRIAYQRADEASVSSRQAYFLRSLAIFEVAKANCLYAGAMLGSLTAVTTFSTGSEAPLVAQVLYVLGPALLGLLGHALARRYVEALLRDAPALRRTAAEARSAGEREGAAAKVEQLRGASWRMRLSQLGVPALCIVAYLVWSGSGVHQEALRRLMLPVSSKGWMLILPYALLLPWLVVRDRAQLRWAARRASGRADEP